MPPSSPADGPVLGVPGLRHWAVVGDVLNARKPAFSVCSRLEDCGRKVYRVSPYIRETTNECYKTFDELVVDNDNKNVKIDAVNLVVSPRIGVTILERMAKEGIKYVFIQPGADGGDVLARASELGLTVQRGCVLVTSLPELK